MHKSKWPAQSHPTGDMVAPFPVLWSQSKARISQIFRDFHQTIAEGPYNLVTAGPPHISRIRRHTERKSPPFSDISRHEQGHFSNFHRGLKKQQKKKVWRSGRGGAENWERERRRRTFIHDDENWAGWVLTCAWAHESSRSHSHDRGLCRLCLCLLQASLWKSFNLSLSLVDYLFLLSSRTLLLLLLPVDFFFFFFCIFSYFNDV